MAEGPAPGSGRGEDPADRGTPDGTPPGEDHPAVAETLIAGDLAGRTPGQVAAMIGRAVVTVDPEGARKRRERAQRQDARVRFWREHAGTAALAGFGLPPGEGLAADQHIQDRALAYRAAGMSGTLDQLRVRAFLDALNGTSSRPAPSQNVTGETGTSQGDTGETGGTGGTGGEPGQGGNGSSDTGGNRNGNGPAGTGGPGNGAGLAAATMLTIPLATLLGLAQRPGDACGLGALDPDLARQLAARAARGPRSTWCVTVTDDQGHAIGHGCARPARTKPKPGHGTAAGNRGSPSPPSQNGSRAGPGLSFTPGDDHRPPEDGGTAPGT